MYNGAYEGSYNAYGQCVVMCMKCVVMHTERRYDAYEVCYSVHKVFFFFFGAYEMCYGAFVTSSCWSRDGCID